MNRLQEDVAESHGDATGRIGKTRRPIFRIYEIHAAIRSGRYPNCSQLAKELSVQRKTIQRDITFMRDELKLPSYADSLHGFFTIRRLRFPGFPDHREELAGLFLAAPPRIRPRNALAEVLRRPSPSSPAA